MKTALLKTMTVVAAVGGLSLISAEAMAGCGTSAVGKAGPKQMMFRGTDGGGLIRTDWEFPRAPITGLWKFTFTAEGDVGTGAPPDALPFPNGTPVDAGFVTWHDDGTEIMNSGRSPASGSFCMGAWKRTGERTYVLTHWALSWIPDYHPGETNSWTQVPGGIDEIFQAFGPANIRETITLSANGNSYTGTFQISQYVNDGTKTPIWDVSGAPVAFVIVGTVAGARVTVD
jgi:hypothetical protein